MGSHRSGSFLTILILFIFSLHNLAHSAVVVPGQNAAVFGNLNLAHLNKHKYGSTEHDLELLWDAIIPRHLQHFLKIYQVNSESKAFLDDVFEVVESADCKGHIREWFKRASNLTNLLSEKNQWVLQSQ